MGSLTLPMDESLRGLKLLPPSGAKGRSCLARPKVQIVEGAFVSPLSPPLDRSE